jgi:4-carboxymuconolactone decarboxylase
VVTSSQASLLRLLSIGDETSIRDAVEGRPEIALDGRTAAIARLASLIVRGSGQSAYQRAVQAALDAGVSVDEICALLLVLAQPAGTSAVISAAPKVALALGYDVAAGLEEMAS